MHECEPPEKASVLPHRPGMLFARSATLPSVQRSGLLNVLSTPTRARTAVRTAIPRHRAPMSPRRGSRAGWGRTRSRPRPSAAVDERRSERARVAARAVAATGACRRSVSRSTASSSGTVSSAASASAASGAFPAAPVGSPCAWRSLHVRPLREREERPGEQRRRRFVPCHEERRDLCAYTVSIGLARGRERAHARG
jgi:hypothetical protein